MTIRIGLNGRIRKRAILHLTNKKKMPELLYVMYLNIVYSLV